MTKHNKEVNKSSFTLDNNSLDTENVNISKDDTTLDDNEKDGVRSLKWTEGRYIRNHRHKGLRDDN